MEAKPLLYRLTLFFLILTGVAQMPIFKRYYIADLPGLGWLAQFYTTHSLHYALASMLLALAAFAVVQVLLERRLRSLTWLGWVKAATVLGLMVTGLMMVVRNLPGVYFSHAAIHFMNLAHLGCCLILVFASVWGQVKGTGWTDPN